MRSSSLRVLALIVFSISMCLLLVHKRAEIIRARYELGNMEREIMRLEKQEQEMLLKLTELKAPNVLAEKVKLMNLDLLDPISLERAVYLARRRARRVRRQ